MVVKSGVQIVVDTADIIDKDKDIYIILFNKYKEQIEKENANKKIGIITACQNCQEYALLTLEEQNQLFLDLMSIDKKFK